MSATKVADLYIGLGIQGAGKTLKALGETDKGLKGIWSTSLAVKAAIVAAVVAMERLMSGAAKTGMELKNFEALTGLSAKTLQQWQYAGQQAGASANDTANSIKSVQDAMTKMLMNEGAPKGLALVANATKNFDVNRVRDTFYVMDQLQTAANKLPKDLGTQALKSFGLTDSVIAAMRRNAFRPEVMKRADVFGAGEQNQLDRTNAGFVNLERKIEMFFGHFTAKHGPGFIQGLTRITEAVMKLIDAFIKLGEKLHIFDGLAKLVEMIADPLEKFSNYVGSFGDLLANPSVEGFKKAGKDYLSTLASGSKLVAAGPGGKAISAALQMADQAVNGKKATPSKVESTEKGKKTTTKELSPKTFTLPNGKTITAPIMNGKATVAPVMNQKSNPSIVAPKKLPSVSPSPSSKSQQNTFNQTLNFNGPADPAKTGNETKKAVSDAYRQMSAQSQGT